MPGFRTTPDDLENPDYPTYPNYPYYPNFPSYPVYPTYSPYPPSPPNPGDSVASSSQIQAARDGSFAITTTHRVSPVGPSPATPALVQTAASSPIVLGVDSLVPSAPALLANARSQAYLGRPPQFWARYFYAPGQVNTSGRRDTHYSAAENAMLRANAIRVLPIARQTTHVATVSTAADDARQNAAAIFEVFPAQYLSGADPDVLIFLDVEQDNPMTEDYYTAWSKTIIAEAARVSNGRVRFHPGVYGSQGDDQTWTELSRAMNNGAVCDGVWIARYYYNSPSPRTWNDHLTNPKVPLLCPILSWQYWESPDRAPEELNFDTNLASPTHFDILIDRLIMPPG
jgi:hypothetical protein